MPPLRNLSMPARYLAKAISDLIPLGLPAYEERLLQQNKQFHQAKNVFLSPHFDDICFSLGGLVIQIRSGIMINVFTRGNRVIAEAVDIDTADADAVHRLRDSEDRNFARAVGLDRIDLKRDEPSVHGRASRDLTGLHLDIAQAQELLQSTLVSISDNTPPERQLNLFCPAGIGNHVNHVAVTKIVATESQGLFRNYRIFFYEDLPYATDRRWRRIGLMRLMSLFPGRHAARHVLRIGDRKRIKQNLMQFYASQLSGRPGEAQRFELRTATIWEAHEALWEFIPSPD